MSLEKSEKLDSFSGFDMNCSLLKKSNLVLFLLFAFNSGMLNVLEDRSDFGEDDRSSSVMTYNYDVDDLKALQGSLWGRGIKSSSFVNSGLSVDSSIIDAVDDKLTSYSGSVDKSNISSVDTVDFVSSREEFVKKYAYSIDKFESKEAYFDFLVSNLEVSDLNDFFRFMFRYSVEYEALGGNDFVTMPSSNDHWADHLTFITRYDDDYFFKGDCEDLAKFAEMFASAKGFSPFTLAVDRHVLTGWFGVDENGVSVLYFVNTISTPESDAYLERFVVDEGSKKEVVSEYAETDPDILNLGFLIDDHKVYLIPSNFSMAMRYQEIKKLLKNNDFLGFRTLVTEEILKDPSNIMLRMSYLHCLCLLDADLDDIRTALEDILLLVPSNVDHDLVFDIITKTAYYLRNDRGLSDLSTFLLEGALQSYVKGWHVVNMTDILSDFFVEDENFKMAYLNEIRLLNLAHSFEGGDYFNIEMVDFNIRQRFSDYPDYVSWLNSHLRSKSTFVKTVLRRDL